MEIIKPIHAFTDNYIWALLDEEKKTAWIVDPGDAMPVIQFLNENPHTLSGILITHHHADHSSGISVLKSHYGEIPVVGSHLSKVAHISHPVKEGDDIHHFKVLEIPGHTLDHIAFFNKHSLFCGDTLFSGGCGKVFEGTYAQMYASLMKIFQLPAKTQIYCGHEYTLQNLLFAEHIEPDNQLIKNKIQEVRSILQKGQPTLPSTLKEEAQINPFLRCADPAIIAAVETHTRQHLTDPVEVFRLLRHWKNTY